MRPDGTASHTRAHAPILPLLLAALVASGCPSEPADDDDATALAADDDDATTPPPVLADILGVVNLTNVRQPGGTDYVDLSGAFGAFAAIDTTMLAPSAYLGQWGYDAPRWRYDLGAFPVPPLGEDAVLDLLAYTPWNPHELLFWDAGDRVEVGPYLSLRLVADNLVAYQVEDPLVPGGAAWAAGGTVLFGTSGGADIVAWAAPTPSSVPQDVGLLEPLAGATVTGPAARDLTVRWTPRGDGADVTVVLFQGLGVAYVAHVPDTGAFALPAARLHDELGPGTYELVVGRTIETALPHPQGTILLRVRAEERASVELQPDLVLTPAYAEPGVPTNVVVEWFTGAITQTTTLDLGPGVAVQTLVPAGGDGTRGIAQILVGESAAVGPRAVTIADGADSFTLDDAFTVMNLLPSDDCADADALPPLEPGVFSSSTAGLTNSLSSGYACFDWSLNAADAVYALDLAAGQTVRITATAPAPADAALALLATCGDPASALACSDVGFEGDPETLLHTALADETVYVVVDGYYVAGFGAPSSPFELVIEEPPPASPIDPPWIVPGTSRTLRVPGSAPWDAGIVVGDVDLGADLVVDAVSIGASPTDLLVDATADGAAALGPRTVMVASGATQTFVDALYVTAWPAADTCAEADALGPVAPGPDVLTGWAPARTSAIGATGCFSWGSEGPDVVFALDLQQGERLGATLLSAEDTQLYVVTDCADAMGTCVAEASSDVGLTGEPEGFSGWEVPATGRYYLVVDTYLAPLDPVFAYELAIAVE